jgi:nitrogen fixation NifU-like protein
VSGPAYSDAVLDHLRRPRGAGALPREDPDVRTGEAGDADDGRLVRMQLRVAGDRVDQARFKAFGCAATIASASWLAERLPGRSLESAGRIGAGEIRAGLGLPEAQSAAAELALRALRAALAAAPGL